MSIPQGQEPPEDASLVETTHPMSSYPAFPAKQVVLGGAAVVLLVTMFLPWWDAEIPLDRVNDTLNGWLMLAVGFSFGSLGSGTGYSWFGNILFGLVPVLPALALAVLLALRVLRLYVSPTNLLSNYAIFAAIGSVWLLLFGFFRVDAANGVYPPMVSPWIVLIVSIVVAVLCRLWWRTERLHFPATRFLGFGRARRRLPEAGPNAGDDLFTDLDADADSEDELLSLEGNLRVGGSSAARDAGATTRDADALGDAASGAGDGVRGPDGDTSGPAQRDT